MTSEVTITLSPDEAIDADRVREALARVLGGSTSELPPHVLRKRSLDARRGHVRFHLVFEIGGRLTTDLAAPHPREVGPPRTVIVGGGPAGLFCAYALARAGIGSVVVDRGKPVQPRRRDLKGLNRLGTVDPNSNYCFGEGGAGTYSDGKLYTRAHKRGPVRDVIEILAKHGAPAEILTEARPHIGSNRLPVVVTQMREELERVGVQFRFDALVESLLLVDGEPRRVAGVRLAGGDEIQADSVVLATGHSASDVYVMLERCGVPLEPKAFALGVRIEHPQPLIDGIQYGVMARHPALPAAAYRLAETIDGRGVFSFCMCPGGFIVPATTEPGAVVVNGMSLSKRNSPFANSGLVVGVEPADVERAGFRGPIGGVELLRRLERAAFEAGGGMLRAPATRVTDFVANRASTTVPRSSYVPGITAADVATLLDSCGLALSQKLRTALRVFDGRMRGYVTEDAVLVGVETRTSSPVRVPRDPETLESRAVSGLYPAGEGAGYAGGIVSAGLDGMRVAERIGRLNPK
jgi:uncharacterized FAD-dependent dehydrogenase